MENSITYKLKRSTRARLIRISVSCDAGVVVTVPFGMEENLFERFIKAKTKWILAKLNLVSKYKDRLRLKTSVAEYEQLKASAQKLAVEKVKHWNSCYNFRVAKIRIKNSKTRWGSCSKQGNLNFHYKITQLPLPLLNYLIVHELCHLKEMNHSSAFWQEVSKTIPDYKTLRKQLKNVLID